MTMILAHGKLSDAGVITGPIGLGDLVLTNLQKQSLQEPYRFSGTGASLVVDLGSAKAIRLAALIGHTLDANATITVSAGTTDACLDFTTGSFPAQSQLEFDPAAPARAKNLFYQLFDEEIYQYWKFDIAAPGATTTDIGRLYLSDPFQPTFNMVFGMIQGLKDYSTEFVTLSADSISQQRPKVHVSEFSLEDLTEDESYGELLALDDLLGTNTDVLFIPFPETKKYVQRNSVYGKIAELTPVAWSSWQRFRKQYRVTELPPL